MEVCNMVAAVGTQIHSLKLHGTPYLYIYYRTTVGNSLFSPLVAVLVTLSCFQEGKLRVLAEEIYRLRFHRYKTNSNSNNYRIYTPAYSRTVFQGSLIQAGWFGIILRCIYPSFGRQTSKDLEHEFRQTSFTSKFTEAKDNTNRYKKQ